MVRILACKSMARESILYSTGWEIRLMCYKKADESLLRCPNILLAKSTDRRLFSEHSVKPTLTARLGAEHSPSALGPIQSPASDEVSPGPAGRGRAGCGPRPRPPFRPRTDHRPRKCGLRGSKQGQESGRFGGTGSQLYQLPRFVSSLLSQLPGHDCGDGFRCPWPRTSSGGQPGESSQRRRAPIDRRSLDRGRPRLQAIRGGTSERGLPMELVVAARRQQSRQLRAETRAVPKLS